MVLVLGLCSLPAIKVDAKGGGGFPGKGKARATPVHHHVTIESVSATSITIDEPGGVKTYKIDKTTEITFKGQAATVDQLQAGMRVEVTPDAADETLAGQIQADDPPHDPTPKPTPAK